MSEDEYPPKLKVDVLSQTMMLFGVMMATFFVTYSAVDFVMAFRALFMLSLLFGGVSVGLSWHYLSIDEGGLPASRILYLGLVGFIGLALTQIVSMSMFTVLPGDLSAEQLANIFLSCIAAIGEEPFFRGVIMQWLIDRFHSPLGGILGSAALFSLTHMSAYDLLANPWIGVALFLNGVVFGLLAWYSGRLSVSQAAHLTLNLIASGVV